MTIQDSVKKQISECFRNIRYELETRDAKIQLLENEVETLKQSDADIKHVVETVVNQMEDIENIHRRFFASPQLDT